MLNGTDFTNANLSGNCFNSVSSNDFAGVKFAGANLRGVNFGSGKLSGASFAGLDLTNAWFGSANLTGVDFRGATVANTSFSSATLTGANLSGLTFTGMRSDIFTSANLTNTKFVGSTFPDASGCWGNAFRYAVLNGTDFTNANLSGNCLSTVASSQILNTVFAGANLTSVSLTSVNLGTSVFTNATITSATLNGANLSGVSGIGAQGTSIATNGSTQLPSMWRVTSGTLYVTRAPSDAPAITSTSVGDGSITVNWSAPTANTGDATTGYLVCIDSACSTVASSARTATVTGLTTPGVRSVTVAASNAGGPSPVASTTALPRTAPSAPVLGITAVADGSLALNWSAPVTDGGYSITGFRACVGALCQDLDASAVSVTFTGLVGGTDYTLRVRAINSLGSSADAVTNAAPTPFVVPSRPVVTSASLSGLTLSLAWQAPVSTGGAPITGYVVCANQATRCREVDAATTSIALKLNDPLTDFNVRAVNSVGSSVASRGLVVGGRILRSGVNLAGLNFSGADLSRVDLADANLSGANLSGTDLFGASLAGADFSGANLVGARLSEADLSGAKFAGADMRESLLHRVLIDEETDFRLVDGVDAVGNSIVGTTDLLPEIWSLSAGRLLVMVEPSAPKLLGLTRSTQAINVTWEVPENNGGGRILGYRACVVGGSCSLVSESARGTTLSGLANGATYTVTISARNAAGYSPVDSASISLPEAPSAPQSVETTAGPSSIAVRWLAPTSSGGSRITSYSICAGATCVSAAETDRSATISGLSNGTGYAVTVVAVNAYGRSVANTEAGTVVPYTSPSAPSITSVVGTDQTLTINWSAGFNGGSALTGNRVCVNRSVGRTICVPVVGSATSASVPGLVNGATYDVVLTASNIAGGISVSSTGVPSTLADVPKIVSATHRPGAVDLVWEAPKFDGGAALTKYQICAGASCVNLSASATSGSVTGLANGSTYALTVKVFNVHGASDSEARSIHLPGAPSASEIRSVLGTDGSLTIRWNSPSSNGGSPVTGYRVCVSTTCSELDATARDRTVTDLVNGTIYEVRVSASSAYGTSVVSTGSGTPFTTPTSPSITSVVSADSSLDVSWAAAFDGGSDLIGYEICATPDTGRSVCVGAAAGDDGALLNGLKNGTAYAVSVVARNAAGAATAASATGTPSTVPTVPKILSATMRPNGVDVTWAEPRFDGGAPLLRYQVCADATCVNISASATGGAVMGLTNGLGYSVTVKAVNLQGSSETMTVPVTLAGTPDAPTDVSATPSGGAISVRWAAPVATGGSRITGYSLCANAICVDAASTERSAVIPGLTNGASYAVQVRAVTSYGTSIAASGGSIVPFTTPDAPSISSVVAGNRSLAITWIAGNTGGALIIGHRVCAVPADPAARSVCASVEADAGTATITGLRNGVGYSVTVTSRNAAGAGIAAESAGVPASVPWRVTTFVATARSGAVELSWSEPTFDGGTEIVGYTVCVGAICQTIDADERTARFEGLVNGTRYDTTIFATNGQGSSTLVTRSFVPSLIAGP